MIQAGEAVRVLVPLAYRLVLRSAEAPGRGAVVEKTTAIAKVSTELSEDQPAKTGRQEKQSWRGERQHLISNHQRDREQQPVNTETSEYA